MPKYNVDGTVLEVTLNTVKDTEFRQYGYDRSRLSS